jgi:hypothetical protein
MQSTIVPLSETQRAAHRGAYYHAATPRSMPLRVDVHSTDLTQLMRKRFVQTAALLTAHNPAGKKQAPAKNKNANAALLARIEALGLAWLPGHRKAFKEGDPDEEGYLVFDISGGQLEALMVEFDQEVALWCPASGTPVLMLHPRARRNYSAADLAWEKLMKESGSTITVSRAPKEATVPAKSGKPAAKTKEVATATAAASGKVSRKAKAPARLEQESAAPELAKQAEASQEPVALSSEALPKRTRASKGAVKASAELPPVVLVEAEPPAPVKKSRAKVPKE